MIAAFLEEIRRAVPSFDVTPADVVREFRGLLPAAKDGTSVLARRPVIRDHSRNGGPTGLYSVAGVKFTTAPGVARLVLDRAFGPAPTRREEFLAHPPAFPARMTPELFGRLREESPEQAAAYLRSTVSEESVAFEEDLVLGRLDWGLDLEDTESASLDLAGLPGAPALPRRTTSLP
jgi:glycerol-3-phosphate dehydrogenase